MWFTPNIGSPDLLELFTRPEAWPNARARIDVFEFYATQLLGEDVPCPACGPNRYPALQRAGAFDRLPEWNLGIAIEVGVLKSGDCTAAVSTPLALEAVRRVRAAGAAVRYLALDEPLLGGFECGLSHEESFNRTTSWIQALRSANPEVSIGDTEPYPVIPADALIAWLQRFQRENAPLAFFHLDVDRALAARIGSDVVTDVRALSAACRSAGVPFGVILWGADGTSDQAYSEDALIWTQTVADALDGFPEHTLFQSWVTSPDGAQRLPTNLPENDPAVFSHTRLVNQGFALLRATERAALLKER